MPEKDTNPKSGADAAQAQGGQTAEGSQDQAPTTTDTAGADQSTDDSQDQADTATSAQDGAEGDKAGDQDDTPADDDGDDDDQGDQDDSLTDDEQERLDEKTRRSLSKVRREAANLRDRLKGETGRADRAEVALAAGLPQDALKFLHGETREELETNAADLLTMLGYQGRVTPSGIPSEVGVTPGGGEGDTTPDLDSIGQRIYQSNN